jgi:predicted adenine nucleotide alpha hydrolase (AANH) superfamily ATPase
MKNKILLHICCGICAGYCVLHLREEGFEVTGFFYNPNIYPPEEYKKRLETAKKVADELGFELIEGEYKAHEWLSLTEKLKDEPEGGKRCELCYAMRLAKTDEKARELKIPFFTTTLSISPHKDALVINNLGREISRECFKEYYFRKKDGFKKTMDIANNLNLYHQHYCGCVYSMKKGV